jgi:hypothetical protein
VLRLEPPGAGWLLILGFAVLPVLVGPLLQRGIAGLARVATRAPTPEREVRGPGRGAARRPGRPQLPAAG